MKNSKLQMMTLLATVATTGFLTQAFAQEGLGSGAIGSGIIRAIESPNNQAMAVSAKTQLPPILQGKVSIEPSAMPPIVRGVEKSGRAKMPTLPSLRMPSLKMPSAQLPATQTAASMPPIVSSKSMEEKQTSMAPIASTVQSKIESAVKPIGTGMLAPMKAFAKNEVELEDIDNVQQTQYSAPAARLARSFAPTRLTTPQGSSSRNIGGGIIPGMSASPAPPIISGTISPSVEPYQMPQAPVINSGSEYIGGPAAPVMSYPEYSAPLTTAPATPTYFDSPPVSTVAEFPVASGCNDCGPVSSMGGVSNCETCGPNGCYDSGQVNTSSGTFGSVSSARRYFHAEAMYMTREDGDVTLSNFGGLGDFSFELGWRFTVGQRSDAVRGTEVSYFGAQPFSESRSQTDSFGRLNALFFTGGGFTGVETTTFFNATEQTQFKDTVLHSIEFNRVRWGWDVLKTFVGWRYFHMEDDYVLTSTNTAGTGTYRLDTANNAIGPQVGAELFYDIGYRWSFSVLGKYGLHVNFNQADTFLNNAGLDFIDTDSESVTLSSSAELGLLAHYQIRPNTRFRAGYTALFLGNMATVSDNFTPGLSPLAGFDGRDADDTFFHGFSFGLEIFR